MVNLHVVRYTDVKVNCIYISYDVKIMSLNFHK